jgi:protein O-GlcNAc transferase
MTQEAYGFFRKGLGLQNAGQLTGALECYDAALAMRPRFAEAQLARAHVLWAMGCRGKALASTDIAIAIRPSFAEAHFNRGFMLQQQRRLQDALESYSRAARYKPDLVEAWNNSAGLLQLMKRYPEALENLEKVLALTPDSGTAHYNRATILLELQRFDEAEESLLRALALNPDHPDAFGCLARAAIGACNWAKVAALTPRLLQSVAEGTSVVPPVVFLGQSDDLALQRSCAETNLKALLAAPEERTGLWQRKVYDHCHIRVAYMSSNFGDHPVAKHMVDLLERHSRSDFEVIGISLEPDDGSELRSRIIKACDAFHDVTAQSDADVAALLLRHKIDILVDLNGQTLGWRPAILAQRPVQVQVSFLGYAGTTGADFVDYVIADAEALPADRAPYYSEKIVHLPKSFWPSDPKPKVALTPTRSACGLPEKGIVFCAFNNHHKISAPVFACWMRLLAIVPASILWLRGAPDAVVRNLSREADEHGIDPARLVFAPIVAPDMHLARHRLCDLFLDTFPYNAHSSASDALCMGVPLVTLRGQSFAARIASSMLHALDLPELVTDSLQSYESLALALAQDPARLQKTKNKLALNLRVEPLFDGGRFCNALETAYRTMQNLARSGKAPQSFSV